MKMMREYAALSASAASLAFNTPESARPSAASSTPTDSARSLNVRRAWSQGVQDFSFYRRMKLSTPGLARPSSPEHMDPELIGLWHNGCARAASVWDQYPDVENDHILRKELLYSPRAQQFFVNSATSAPDGAALITTAAVLTPMTSPPRKYRSSAPLISGVRAQLYKIAASRIAALARGRAARKVARDARSLSLTRRFRPTATRSGAAVDIARVFWSYLARRRCRRGGDRAAAAAAANDGIIVLAATTTPAPPPTPNARRGRRGRRTPAPDGSYHGDLGGYGGSSDDDSDRSCFSPPGAHFERYKEYAHEAHGTFKPDLEGQVLMDGIISVNDDGTPKPLSSP